MLTFVIAIVAGVLSPRAVPFLKDRVADILPDGPDLSEAELQVFAFALLMVLVGLLAFLSDSGSPLGLALGGLLGRFGKRIADLIRSRT